MYEIEASLTPCSGGFPVLICIEFKNGIDHVMWSWYSGNSDVEPMDSLFVERWGKCYPLTNENQRFYYRHKDILVDLYEKWLDLHHQ